jgi:hypothetical protein
METLQTLESLTLDQLKEAMVVWYDGNAGEIIHGFMEMGLKGEKLKAALIRYIRRVES